jgi:hypothetical protein
MQNIQDYGFRLYNPSIAKFLSVDPLAPKYPWYTPYQFAGNMPITFIDLDGLEPAVPENGGNGPDPIAASYNIDPVEVVDKGQSKMEYSMTNTGSRNRDMEMSPGNDADIGKINSYKKLDLENFGEGRKQAKKDWLRAYNTGTWSYSGADILAAHFIHGGGSDLNLGSDHSISRMVGEYAMFRKFSLTFEEEALKHYNRNNGIMDDFDGFNALITSTKNLRNPDGWNPRKGNLYFGDLGTPKGVFLYTVLGGYSDLKTEITLITSNEISVKYTISDHFGADAPDARRILPGLAGVYYLQNYHCENGKHHPFVWSVEINRSTSLSTIKRSK